MAGSHWKLEQFRDKIYLTKETVVHVNSFPEILIKGQLNGIARDLSNEFTVGSAGR